MVYSFEAGAARAQVVDPADGRVLGEHQPSTLSRWVKTLHRSFLLGDAGRLAAAGVALALLPLSVAGLVLLARRLGGWRRLLAPVRGTPWQRLHVAAGRAVVALLCLSSLAALYLSAATFGLVAADAPDAEVASTAGAGAELPADRLPLLQQLRVHDLRRLNFPDAADPADSWKVATVHGRGWIDRHSGRTLAWQSASAAQRLHDAALLLHTGQGAWAWAAVLAVVGGSLPLFWVSGLVLWWQARRRTPGIADNSAAVAADVLLFVASENGSTWGFAQALHQALVRGGHRVHSAGLEHFRVGPAARQVLLLAATHGDGQAPAHAARALQRIAGQPPATAAKVAVLGFGDRQFGAFCGFAEALDEALRARGWAPLLPLERIHRQSAQQFARWGEALAQALGEPLALDYRPRLPAGFALELRSRQDYPAAPDEPAVILRFDGPARGWKDRPPRFVAGDLLGVLPPGAQAPRLYSLASGTRDGFVEICVRRRPGGYCSTYLHALRPGQRIHAFIQPNPGFVLQRARRPVVMIGAGTGIAPLAGFIRGNVRRWPMHLYFGARDPARDFYFDAQIQRWLGEQRLASLRTSFSRIPGGGGYVQDALRRDAARLRELVRAGAVLRVCGSRAMARGVSQALDAILAASGLSVQQLKARGRYAEDVF